MAKINSETSSTLSLSSSTTTTTSSTKTKIASQPNIIRKNSLGPKSPARIEKKPCAEVSFKDFLNFLRTAYEISGNAEGNPPEKEFEWKSITTNELITTLFGISDVEIKQASEHASVHKATEEAKQEMAELDIDNKFLSLKKAESSHLEKVKSNKRDSLSEISGKKLFEGSKSVEHLLKRKLNEVIQEGLLDSVLPYVVPKQSGTPQSAKKSAAELKKAPSIGERSIQQNSSKDKANIAARRKSNTASGEVEVEIHVCDELKNLKRDFRCSQKLLVSKMGYFAEVTTGQKLEDMDISVHCDITIFDWLMRWVKQDLLPEESWPKLDASNVVPIMVSAAFLQMDPLLQDCLKFCRLHMSDIIKTSSNLACLNDSILTRLANLFTNADLEELRDKKDKIQSRLYCKLIASLTESCPEPARGHYASLAGVYCCGKCDKLVLRQMAPRIPCKPSNMKMDRYGNVHANHMRDPNWNLNDYIRGQFDELKSWRAVYWRLWGDCHFMYCASCRSYFPVNQARWCCHHPDPPQFFTMEHQRSTTFPIGRYPCCGARSYRFEVLKNESGCQYKDHIPLLATERDVAVHKVYMTHQKLISLDPPQVIYPERLTKIVSSRMESESSESLRSMSRELLWWEGLELAPPRPRHGLLSKIWENQLKKDAKTGKVAAYRNLRRQPSAMETPVPSDAFTDVPTRVSTDEDDDDDDDDDDSSSSDSDNSEESAHAGSKVRVTTKPRRPENHHFHGSGHVRMDSSRQWLAKLSIRSNQDNQRECEEQSMRQMVQLLTRRTCGESGNLYNNRSSKSHGHGHYHHSIWNNHITPIGGTYVRLEQEWKEAHSHNHNCHTTGPNRQRSVSSSLSARPKLRGNR